MTPHHHPEDRPGTPPSDGGPTGSEAAAPTDPGSADASSEATGREMAARRDQMSADIVGTLQEATARQLSDAIAEYDAALDRGAPMPELRELDREVARAERDHTAAGRSRPRSS